MRFGGTQDLLVLRPILPVLRSLMEVHSAVKESTLEADLLGAEVVEVLLDLAVHKMVFPWFAKAHERG